MLLCTTTLHRFPSEFPFWRSAAEPYEMAGAVAYMCSNDSSYMTGETMLLGGGGPARL